RRGGDGWCRRRRGGRRGRGGGGGGGGGRGRGRRRAGRSHRGEQVPRIEAPEARHHVVADARAVVAVRARRDVVEGGSPAAAVEERARVPERPAVLLDELGSEARPLRRRVRRAADGVPGAALED